MASHSGGSLPLCDNTETTSDPSQNMELSEFLKTATLPICVCVVSGKHLSSSVQITKGDILFLKSCETRTVTLTHQCSKTGSRKQVNVPLDFPYKFTVLPPKTVSDRTASMIMYPSIGDLLLDSPTHFEATSSYDDPYLPGFSVHRGDKFKFRGLVTDPKDGRERLKVFDELENVLFLSLDCRANFCPIEDDESYTLRELIDFAPVPRRLRMAKTKVANEDFKVAAHESSESKLSDDQSISQLINYSGVIHMLKPNLIVIASPLNDTDTVWKIPLTADLCVRQHDLDDYEVPSLVRDPSFKVSSPPPTPQTPTFPAPPTPPMPQPLVPVDVRKFSDIYGCPVKARVMETSKCHEFLQNLIQISEDITIYRLEKTKRLYAEDVKSGAVFSFAKDFNLSFIEYPEKFSVVSELLRLPVGSEITVLEDIASDFPSPFFLQFGDTLRVTTNTPYTVRAKHTSVDCKILKCERVNKEGGSNVKMKLPLDFEVKMVICSDPNDRKVISLKDIILGRVPIPSQEVATLLDGSEKTSQDLPVKLKLLKTLPERLLVLSPFVGYPEKTPTSLSEHNHDWPSPSHHSAADKNIGVSLTSRLVLAFRERLDVYEMDVLKAHADAMEVPFEVLTRSDYNERERICKDWMEEEDQSDKQSVASDEPPSSIHDTSSQDSATFSRKPEKTQKHRKMDKIRRLSQVLNPKHWRPSKAAPEPLPHPSAMGLMALSMRPHSEQNNDYETKGQSEERTSQSAVSVSSDDDMNVYEDVQIGPVNKVSGSPPPDRKESKKRFAGPLHKSMPVKQIVARTYNRNRANKRNKTMMKQSLSSPIHEKSTASSSSGEVPKEKSPDNDEEPLYAFLEPSTGDTTDEGLSNDEIESEKKVSASLATDTMKSDFKVPRPVLTLPPLPPRRSSSSLDQKTTTTVSRHKSLDNLVIQQSQLTERDSKPQSAVPEKDKISLTPPIPPQRKKRIRSLMSDPDSETTKSGNSSAVVLATSSTPGQREEEKFDKTDASTAITTTCSTSDQKKEEKSGKIDASKAVTKTSSTSSEREEEDSDKVDASTVITGTGSTLGQRDEEKSDKTDANGGKPNLSGVQNKEFENKVLCHDDESSEKKFIQQKVPVPKPRGLKKRNPEAPSRTDSCGSQDSFEMGKVKNEFDKIAENGPSSREKNASHTLTEAKNGEVEKKPKCEGSVVKVRDPIKPKPPPKPKPRI